MANTVMHHIHPEDEPDFKENFEFAQTSGLDFSTALRIRTVQGEERHDLNRKKCPVKRQIAKSH